MGTLLPYHMLVRLPATHLRIQARIADDQLAARGWLPEPADRRIARDAARFLRDGRLERTTTGLARWSAADGVSPFLAEFLIAAAYAVLPWHEPLGRADAFQPTGPDASTSPAATAAARALLPPLAHLLDRIAAGVAQRDAPRTPEASAWGLPYDGPLLRGVAGSAHPVRRPLRCPRCARVAPWFLVCDWSRVEVTCTCGVTADDHGIPVAAIALLPPVRQRYVPTDPQHAALHRPAWLAAHAHEDTADPATLATYRYSPRPPGADVD